VRDFCQRFSLITNTAVSLTDAQRSANVGLFLAGHAQDVYYRRVESDSSILNGTWVEVQALLVTLFGDPKAMMKAQDAFRAIGQCKRSVQEYDDAFAAAYLRVQNLGGHIPVMDEIQVYVKGLRRDIGRVVSAALPETLAHAQRVARAYDDCDETDRGVAERRVSDDRLGNKRDSQVDGEFTRGTQDRTVPVSSAPSDMYCHVCSGYGHRSADCATRAKPARDAQIVCNRCRGKEHLERVCTSAVVHVNTTPATGANREPLGQRGDTIPTAVMESSVGE
jgi:hypothetical protein